MPNKYTYLFLLGLILLSSFAVTQQNEEHNIKLITPQTQYEVGNPIILKFSTYRRWLDPVPHL